MESVIDGSPLPQFIIDKDHKVIYWNKSLEEYSKIKAKDIVGTRKQWEVFYGEKRPCLVDLLVDEDFEAIDYWFSDGYKKSELVEGAYEAEISDGIKGKDKFLRFTASPIKDSKGNIIGGVESFEDISKRKIAEKNLKKSERKFRSLVENLNVGVYRNTNDIKGHFIQVNPAFARMFGYNSVNELMQIKVSDLYLDPLERKLFIEEINQKGKISDKELLLKKKNNNEIWASVSAQAHYNENGIIDWIDGIIEDISERKESEKRLNTKAELLNLTHDAIFTRDLNDRITFWNLAAEKTYGWSQEDALGEKIHTLLHTQFTTPLNKIKAEVLKQGHWDGELTHTKRDGSKIIVSSRWSIQKNGDGEHVGFMEVNNDITQRKKAENKIRAAEKRYRSIVQHLNDGFIIHDFEGNIFDCNDKAAYMFNSTKEEMIGSHLNEFSTPITPNFSDRIDQLMKTGIFEFDAEYVREDGSILYYNVKASVVSFEGDGRIQSFIRDTTKNTMGEKALKESEKKAQKRLDEIEAIYDSAPIGLCVLDSNLRFVRINNRLAEINGRSIEEHIGKTIGEIVPDLNEQAIALAQEIFETGNTAMGREFNGMTPAQPGVIRTWIEQWYPIKDANGQILGINVGILEITDIKKAEKALRESEEKLRLAITGAEAGMWFWDLKHNDLEWTDRCNTIFGLEKNSEISYDLFLNIIHPTDRDIVNNAFEKSLDTINELKLEIRLLWPDGSLHWAYLLGTVYLDSEGNPKEMMGIVIDISDRKSTEAELRKTLKQLKRSNAELEQFAYVASHDLQEPLRMVTSFLQLLQRRYENQLDSDADEFIHFAVDGATRMQDLINDLLTYSRVGRKTGKIEDVDSEALIEQILFDSKVLIEETNTSITYNDLPLIRANYTQMAQVFQNLIGNAIKYQDNTYPEIHITAKKNGKDWIFKVEDNGIGIDPKHGERIFRIFQRLHGRDEYEGTGIGLAIVKRIIEQHGGMIWYESAPGKGSKFYFTIPQGDDPR
ncbi:PAS domain-containing sensor histidine kinase [Methanobacterium ferruginis]|uniref:PAS domain-containing sensor histidine kinase n=1 Tax=Methanobacterium ferruginis TaxID=710191 RepID=UPI002573C549|nr:PAS domain S-box protein [Methanobacterium ferruginis]BDZ68934.1 hypothetical protein GCM10025860_23820 [Methanobacterium ferruginis]